MQANEVELVLDFTEGPTQEVLAARVSRSEQQEYPNRRSHPLNAGLLAGIQTDKTLPTRNQVIESLDTHIQDVAMFF